MDPRPAVFCDRDGTLIEDRGHLASPDDVRFYPGTMEALRRLAGEFAFFIVTHQPGVADGILSIEAVERVNAHVMSTLAAAGVAIVATYTCPHRRGQGCACIKPNPHFLRLASQQYGIDLARSFVVGDHPHDTELARQAGARGVYVCTGHGWKHLPELPQGEVVVPDIRAAAEWILSLGQLEEQVLGGRSEVVRAGEIVRRGGIVAFPTETVYGLGASAFDRSAVERVFRIKKRPPEDPLIVHLFEAQQARSLVQAFPAEAWKLARRFWPGPLTLVLPKGDAVPDVVTAGLPTVAIRVPNHAVALAFLREAGTPVAAPSANPFGQVSPTTAEHVREQLGREVDLILDGGPCWVGVESTIVSFCGPQPALLRPGGIPTEWIEELIGPLAYPSPYDRIPLAPGRLPRHYAPRTPLVVSSDLRRVPRGKRVGLLCLRRPPEADHFAAVEVLSQSGDLIEAAARLFAALRRLDRCGLDLIVAQPVPEEGLGRAIMDRLRKASRLVCTRPGFEDHPPEGAL